MHSLFLGLRKLVGVLLVAVGFVAGVFGTCLTLTFAWLWCKGEALSPPDRHALLVCVSAGVGGGLAFWAGAMLLRSADPGPGRPASLRLHQTGPQRRRSVHAGWGNTLTWLFVAAEYCFLGVPGNATARFCHALEGTLAAYLGFHAVILLHEFGHLAVAALWGLDLQKLQVGTGPLLFGGRLGGLRAEWRAWLGGGLVLTADGRERGWRARHWLYVASGPTATAAGGLALAWWLGRRHPGASWFNRDNGVADVVAIYLFAHSALLWLLCVLPTRTRVGIVRAHTDGWQLLHTPRYDLEKVRSLIVVTCMRRVEMLWEDGRRELAWARLRELLTRYPARAMLSAAEGYYLAEQGNHAEAAESYGRWLQAGGLPEPVRLHLLSERFVALARAGQPEGARQCAADALGVVSPADRPALLDRLATGVLTHELHAFLPETDAWSQEMRALGPETLTVRGTRGAVLVELGRLDEGEALLRDVWQHSDSEVDAAISAFYLGVAARRRGQQREASRWLRRSRGFAPFVGKWLSARITRELTAPPARADGTPAVEARPASCVGG